MDSNPAQTILDALSSTRRVLVTTHVKPDGDALGSVAAMVLAMKQRGIEPAILLFSRVPAKYGFIFSDGNVPIFEAEKNWPAELSLDNYDALLVLDTGTWSQLPGLRERIENWPKPKLIVDHHRTQEGWATARWVDTEAAAAGEMVADLVERWGLKLAGQIAEAVFLAIATDTGWFQFSNTRPRTLRLAARLLEAGVDSQRLYQVAYQNERPARLALQARLLESLELHADNRLAVMTLSKDDFQKTGADSSDTENLINIPLQVGVVEASILLAQGAGDEIIRVSLRSKGGVDVAKFAEKFGGGGHARAAGFKLQGSLPQQRERIIAAFLENL